MGSLWWGDGAKLLPTPHGAASAPRHPLAWKPWPTVALTPTGSAEGPWSQPLEQARGGNMKRGGACRLGPRDRAQPSGSPPSVFNRKLLGASTACKEPGGPGFLCHDQAMPGHRSQEMPAWGLMHVQTQSQQRRALATSRHPLCPRSPDEGFSPGGCGDRGARSGLQAPGEPCRPPAVEREGAEAGLIQSLRYVRS